jgi:hypothetical protein
MSAAEVSRLFEADIYERVRELIDFCCLLDLEQELWQVLHGCGLARADVPALSAQLIARALTKIGEDHVKLATEPLPDAAIGEPSQRS